MNVVIRISGASASHLQILLIFNFMTAGRKYKIGILIVDNVDPTILHPRFDVRTCKLLQNNCIFFRE